MSQEEIWGWYVEIVAVLEAVHGTVDALKWLFILDYITFLVVAGKWMNGT